MNQEEEWRQMINAIATAANEYAMKLKREREAFELKEAASRGMAMAYDHEAGVPLDEILRRYPAKKVTR